MRSGNEQHGAMPRLLLLTGVLLLMADYSFVQYSPDPTPMQCQLIRLAVAQDGRQMFHERKGETLARIRSEFPESVVKADQICLV